MYHVGCSGWFYPHWNGNFFPAELEQKNWFRYYSSLFDTVEMNSTFYHVPKESTVDSWYRSVGDDFRFTIKANRVITHLKRFVDAENEISNFYRLAGRLKEKLGCILFQFPPSFRYDETRLQNVLHFLDAEYRNVLEFRHLTWFSEDVIRELEKADVAFCNVSTARLPGTCVSTPDNFYLRQHGDTMGYATDYSREALERWSSCIVSARAHEKWIYFNNDYGGFAPKNALQLRSMLSG